MYFNDVVGFDDLCRFAERLFNEGQFEGPVGQEEIKNGARLQGWIDGKDRLTPDGAQLLRTLRA